MAGILLCTGLDPDDPDAETVVVVVAEAPDHHERAAARLATCGYEGDGCFYLVQTDGWAERRLDGDLLTVDIVAHPALLRGLEVDRAKFTARSSYAPHVLRLLRVEARVDPAAYARAPEETLLLTVPAGASAEEAVALVRSGEEWPLVLAPPGG
ncbi:hypothetical protein ACFV2V_22700 [Streptomyces sp. NPDC059698]|uniref:hypothetical protein n=1 Tax=unclassified Streptomyces TaxID=2593676 RepID=UPI000938A2C4|nr:hypothetical protein [Streptomyces sp. CB02366]OKJ39356.1 hypothetical protein AMK24_06725 [Streptomyces sp. CB02366]TVP34981.1 hypothetical protein A3L22_09740 [Streptomyces griseus subsp. griseus]WSS55505.1 hypothetical protein OG543_08985 [Streptomyces sp. NBC_01178]